MWNKAQLRSQIRQMLLFFPVFSMRRLGAHTLLFPFDYYGTSGKAKYPLAINLLVTSKCNVKCEMCNYKNSISTSDELTTGDIKNFIKREAHHKPHVFLSGGEPFVRDDILDIVETVKYEKLTCGIITNGTLLSEKKIKELVGLKTEYIMFSLHGPRDIHDRITGLEGAFNKLIEAITLMSRMRKTTKIFINCVITDSNIDHLNEVIQFASGLPVDCIRIEHLNYLTPDERRKHGLVCEQIFPSEEMKLNTFYLDTNEFNCPRYYTAKKEIIDNQRRERVTVFLKPYLNEQ